MGTRVIYQRCRRNTVNIQKDAQTLSYIHRLFELNLFLLNHQHLNFTIPITNNDMTSNNTSEFIYIDDDMSPDAHHWAQNVEPTDDTSIKPGEAFAWFQDPTFVQNLLKATDD